MRVGQIFVRLRPAFCGRARLRAVPIDSSESDDGTSETRALPATMLYKIVIAQPLRVKLSGKPHDATTF
jgi:hypothetical protein